LSDDWERHGKQAIICCREESPTRYVEIVASIVNKMPQPPFGSLDEITSDDLERCIGFLELRIAANGANGKKG
jgi:hypothetical protein